MSQPLVLPEIVASILMSFAPVFTKPSFETFRHHVGALMLGEGQQRRAERFHADFAAATGSGSQATEPPPPLAAGAAPSRN